MHVAEKPARLPRFRRAPEPPPFRLTDDDVEIVRQVAQHRLLLPKQGRRREQLDDLFAQEKLIPRIGMELDSNELLKRLILNDMGIGFLPKINVLEEVRSGTLKVISIENVEISRDLALISRKDRVLTRAGNAFFTFATGAVRPQPNEP